MADSIGPVRTDRTLGDRLSQIQTRWSALRLAHEKSGEMRQQAQAELLERYQGAVYRYLFAISRSHEVADELFQDFAVRFLNNSFVQADPSKGKFRSYLKTSLIRLTADYFRRQKRREGREQHLEEIDDLCENGATLNCDAKFDSSWQIDLLERTWQHLETASSSLGQPFYEVLRLRSSAPDLDSQGLADVLNEKLNTPGRYSATSIRKLLQRARDRFAELLLDDVQAALGTDSAVELEEELIASGLHGYCKPALEKRR